MHMCMSCNLSITCFCRLTDCRPEDPSCRQLPADRVASRKRWLASLPAMGEVRWTNTSLLGPAAQHVAERLLAHTISSRGWITSAANFSICCNHLGKGISLRFACYLGGRRTKRLSRTSNCWSRPLCRPRAISLQTEHSPWNTRRAFSFQLPVSLLHLASSRESAWDCPTPLCSRRRQVLLCTCP